MSREAATPDDLAEEYAGIIFCDLKRLVGAGMKWRAEFSVIEEEVICRRRDAATDRIQRWIVWAIPDNPETKGEQLAPLVLSKLSQLWKDWDQ
jgi:hypothetical protein